MLPDISTAQRTVKLCTAIFLFRFPHPRIQIISSPSFTETPER